MDTMTTDALLAADPEFAAICDARRDEAIAHMEAAAYRPALDMGAVYREHYASVVRYLRSRGCSRDCAEDIAQTAFVKAHRVRNTYDASRGDVGAWLHTIVRTTLLDAARSKGRRREDATDPTALASYAVAEAPDASPWADDAASVADALRDLPAPQREAIVAHYLDGLSYAEASERLGADAGAVRVRAHRGVSALRASLA